MRKVLAWRRSHLYLVILGSTVVLGVGAHVFLNWTAERRWKNYEREARARGVKLTLPEFAREAIPDEQNFAMLPMMQAAFSGRTPGAFDLPAEAQNAAVRLDPVKEESPDWNAWRSYFQQGGLLQETTDDPRRDILRALEHYAPQMQEWAQWRTRPMSRFALDLKKGARTSLGHLTPFMRAAKVFALKSRLHVSLGEPVEALAAWQEGWAAYAETKEEPATISGLVRLAILAQLNSVAGEGLRARVWSEPELRQLDASLAAVRLRDDYQFALASERGFVNSVYDEWVGLSAIERGRELSQTLDAQVDLGLLSRRWPAALCAFLPRRIFRENQLRENQWFDEMLAFASSSRREFTPGQPTPSSAEAISSDSARAYFFLFRMSAPVYKSVEKKYVAQQTSLDQARLAIALERCRSTRGAYPEKLADLLPEFCAEIPPDPYSPDGYHYQRSGNSGFLLYSVGENRTDDGGKIDQKKKEKDQLDAIWLYAPR